MDEGRSEPRERLAPWPPPGTVDRLFDDAHALRSAEARILRALEARGHREIVLPMLERDGVFSADRAVRFVDRHGEVLGLRADFTGPVARVVATRLGDTPDVRLCYRGTVFRDGEGRRQMQQAGFERFGAGGVDEDVDVVRTAIAIARDAGHATLVVAIGSAALVEVLCPRAPEAVRAALDRRDAAALPASLAPLVGLVGGRDVLERARASLPAAAHAVLDRLGALADGVSDAGARVVVDLAEVRTWSYYTGFVFSLSAADVPRAVAVGGRYDGLVARFGRGRPAVGATFDVDALLMGGDAAAERARPLRLALPRGRIQRDVLHALGARAPDAAALASRALVIDDGRAGLGFILVKDPDVPSYVEHGVADVGVCGLDVVREHPADVLVPRATQAGRCRMCLCGRPGTDVAALARRGTLRVATKYPRTARAALMERGLVAEVLPLQGSVELAVAVDLADAIVDLVETGATLEANGLVVLEDLFTSTAHVLVNRAAYRLRHAEVEALVEALAGGPRP